MLPKASAYVKRCDGQTKWMYCLIEDDDLFINTIWDKVGAGIKKESDSEFLKVLLSFLGLESSISQNISLFCFCFFSFLFIF